MAGYRKITRKLALGIGGTGRVWDAPYGAPVKDQTVYLSTRGCIAGAGDLQWEIYLGGVWDGTPFAEGSTHSGGQLVSSGAIAGGTEIAHRIHFDASMFSTNLRDIHGLGGLPFVCCLTNLKKFDAVDVWVTFLSWASGEAV